MSPSPMSGQVVLQVFIFREGRFWGTECFAQPAVTIGRTPENDLQLDDEITSRNHAQLSVTADGIVLEDLNSSNGTSVNGEPVTRCLVTSRDEIQIGSFLLKVKLLSRARPAEKFHDRTRVVERSSLVKDAATEVVQPEPVQEDMLVKEPPAPKKPAAAHKEILAAVEEVLEQPEEDFETVSTSRIKGAQEIARKESARDDFEAETQVEPSPQAVEEKVFDHGTRWLTPPPDADESIQLAQEPARPQKQEMAPAQEAKISGPSFSAAAPSWPEEFSPSVQVAPELAGQAASGEDEEEVDEDEVPPDFVEPFSLLNNLIRENFAEPQVTTEHFTVLEVIGYASREKYVLSYEQLKKGQKYKIGRERMPLVRMDDENSCTVTFGEDFSGGLIVGGQTVSLNDLKTSANQVATRKGQRIFRYKLQKGDYGNLIRDNDGWFLRFVNPPRIPKARMKIKFDPFMLKVFGSSFLAHVLLIIVLSFFSKKVEAVSDADIDRFAKVAMKEIQAEVPEPEPEVPLDQLPKPEEQKPEEVKQEEKKPEKTAEEKPTKQKPTKSAKAAKGAGGGGDQGGGVGMMAALGNISKTAPSTNIVAAVSNLDAVRVPGAQSRFKVSGIVTKLPTSGLVLSSGSGVGVKTGIDLLRGGKGQGGLAGIGPGALSGGATGKRGVGGVVFQAPKRRMVVQGQLDREAIAAVVRQHLREIQYCYEKNLLLNPNLQGKVVMEWTIATDGSVSIVKTSQNTLATPAVAMCIAANIKGWQFPRPKGGVVVVSYPFIFNTVGF